MTQDDDGIMLVTRHSNDILIHVSDGHYGFNGLPIEPIRKPHSNRQHCMVGLPDRPNIAIATQHRASFYTGCI